MWNIWLIFEQFAWWVTQTSFFKRVPKYIYKVYTHGTEVWDQKCAPTLVKYFQSKVHSSGWKIDKKNTQLGIALKTFWTLCNEISVANIIGNRKNKYAYIHDSISSVWTYK